MNTCLMIVTAPFNLVCFQQAIYDFKIKKAYIYYDVIDEDSENHKQIINKLDELDIQEQDRVFIYSKYVKGANLEQRIKHYANQISYFKELQLDYFFFSEFRCTKQQDFVNTLRHPKTFMLDDGTSSIAFLEYHWPKNIIFSLPNFSTPERKQEANKIKTKLEINLKPFIDIKVYTIFAEQFNQYKNIINNELSYIKKDFNSLDKNSEIIIGTKLVTVSLLSFQDYLTFIKSILERIESKKNVYYIPHRGQDIEYTNKLLDTLPRLKLLQPNMPIENWIGQQQIPPFKIHGYISTAFFMINKIYPQIKINCYALPKKYLNSLKEKTFWGSNLYSFIEGVNAMNKYLPEPINYIDNN